MPVPEAALRTGPASDMAMSELGRALRFLLVGRAEDALWRDFLTRAGEGVDWPTAFIAEQLAVAGVGRGDLDPTIRALRARQHDDGGWGYHADVPTDADSTACALLFLTTVGETGEVIERAADCLVRHQDPESGGVPTYRMPGPIRRYMGLTRYANFNGWCNPHLEVTATVGRALLAVGGAFERYAALAWRYVRVHQREDGSWGQYWWTSPHYPTMQAAALARAFGDSAAVRRAVDWAAARAPTSSFVAALSLSLFSCADLRDHPAARAALEHLLALQEDDGGWPCHPIMRIPPPNVLEPDQHIGWRVDSLGTGVVVRDQHRCFTTAACVAALAQMRAG